jgi:sugar (pentulose or hexulose) kinase
MSHPIYLGIDLGTQSVRVLAVDDTGEVLASASQQLVSQRNEAKHEQEPEAWWTAMAECCRSVMGIIGSRSELLEGLAIDATSGTILILDKDLRAITPALMYDDSRAIFEAEEVNLAGEMLWSQLGYRMQPSWALPKLCWLARHYPLPTAAHLVHQNDFVNARLAGRLLATDSSHALKTGYNLLRSEWPKDIFDKLNLPLSIFPTVVSPGERIGEVCATSSEQTGLPCGLPIFSGMTDGCAAQIAAGAVTPGSWNSVLGTTLVVKGVTTELLCDPLGVVYSHRSADGNWLPGGASSTGAGTLTKEFPNADLDKLNRAVTTAGPSSLIVYPLTGQGERFPFAAAAARGFALGSATTTEARYVGILQGIAFLERLSFDYLRQLGAPMHGNFTFTGGATRSREWNQLRANVLGREIAIPLISEGAFGMAILVAAHGRSLSTVSHSMGRLRETIAPDRTFSQYASYYNIFVQQLESRGWLPAAVAKAAQQGVAS